MSKDEQVTKVESTIEVDIDARLKASEQRIKELQLQENERRIKELERQAELAQKMVDSINAPETQLKTQTKPILKDPSVAYDEFFEGRKNFEMTYGHGEKYNINDPLGELKLKLVLDMRSTKKMYGDDEVVKKIMVEKYKDELSML